MRLSWRKRISRVKKERLARLASVLPVDNRDGVRRDIRWPCDFGKSDHLFGGTGPLGRIVPDADSYTGHGSRLAYCIS